MESSFARELMDAVRRTDSAVGDLRVVVGDVNAGQQRNAEDLRRILKIVEGNPHLQAILAKYEGQIAANRGGMGDCRRVVGELRGEVRDNDKRLDELEAWVRAEEARGSYRDRDLERAEGRHTELGRRVQRGEVDSAVVSTRTAVVWSVGSAVAMGLLGLLFWWLKSGA